MYKDLITGSHLKDKILSKKNSENFIQTVGKFPFFWIKFYLLAD
jgi:hypothetical protein